MLIFELMTIFVVQFQSHIFLSHIPYSMTQSNHLLSFPVEKSVLDNYFCEEVIVYFYIFVDFF